MPDCLETWERDVNFFEKTDKDESLMDIMRPRDGNAARLSNFRVGEIDSQLVWND